mgnify:CR=1 FL=1
MTVRPVNDVVLLEVDPPEAYSNVVVIPDTVAATQPIRKGTVLRVGPGRWKVKRMGEPARVFIPTTLKGGERVVFFSAAMHGKHGAELFAELPDNQALVRESDILFVADHDVKVEV